MKRISLAALLPVLLSLAGCLLLFAQTPNSPALDRSINDLRPVGSVPASITKDMVVARREVLKQQDVVLKAKELAKTNPAAAATAKQAEAQLKVSQQAAAALSKAAAPPIATATKDEAEHLIQLVTGFYQEVKQQALSASRWELALLFTAIGLGFGSSVFSIFGLNKVSAVFSALVVVTGGIPKLVPVHERAVYYRTLTNQSYSLLSGLNIPYQLTTAECDDGARRLQVLEEYRATKYPDTTDVDSTTEDLFKDLNAAKTAVAEAR
jgi:hypothetical protein